MTLAGGIMAVMLPHGTTTCLDRIAGAKQPCQLDQVTTTPATRIADHVPPELVVDLDAYRPMNGDAVSHAPYARLQEKVPAIFWSPYDGGRWVLTRRDYGLGSALEEFSFIV